jgi:hypothetical protein
MYDCTGEVGERTEEESQDVEVGDWIGFRCAVDGAVVSAFDYGRHAVELQLLV